MTIVKFPYSASRRVFARRPRSSENGTPEQRAMLAALTVDKPRVQRRSKNGTPEQRAAKRASATVLDMASRLPSRAAAAKTRAVADTPMTDSEFAAAYVGLTPYQQGILRSFLRTIKTCVPP